MELPWRTLVDLAPFFEVADGLKPIGFGTMVRLWNSIPDGRIKDEELYLMMEQMCWQAFFNTVEDMQGDSPAIEAYKKMESNKSIQDILRWTSSQAMKQIRASIADDETFNQALQDHPAEEARAAIKSCIMTLLKPVSSVQQGHVGDRRKKRRYFKPKDEQLVLQAYKKFKHRGAGHRWRIMLDWCIDQDEAAFGGRKSTDMRDKIRNLKKNNRLPSLDTSRSDESI